MQKYTCPMHPDVITDHPGNCPKCGMKLVPIKEKKRSTSNIEHRTHRTHGGRLKRISPMCLMRQASMSTKKCRWKCTPPSILLIR